MEAKQDELSTLIFLAKMPRKYREKLNTKIQQIVERLASTHSKKLARTILGEVEPDDEVRQDFEMIQSFADADVGVKGQG